MRQKDFQFLTINTKSLWEKGSWDKVSISTEGLSLTENSVYEFENLCGRNEMTDSALLETPEDFAVDECGIIYILDSGTKKILVYDPEIKSSQWLKCFGGPGNTSGKFCKPKSIAISSSDIYIADSGNHRIQSFARINFQLRHIYPFPVEVEIIDIAVDSQDNLYALTQKDKSFAIDYFDKSGKKLYSFSVCADAMNGLSSPTNMTVKDGLIYILEAKKLLTFNIKTKKLDEFKIIGEGEKNLSGIAIAKDKSIYVGAKRTGNSIDEHEFLYKLEEEDNQNKPAKLAKPIMAIQGNCDQLGADSKGNFYILDSGTHELTHLKPSKQYFTRGEYTSVALDNGNKPESQWHKLVVDAEVPDKTRMEVSYYISDIDHLPSDPVWSQPSLINPKDALILNPKGRYIWLKFILTGDGHNTPKVRSVKVYFPEVRSVTRLSYLRYLPAIYQKDEASRNFLERFLSLFETFFFNLEEEIFSITKYFDVESASNEMDDLKRDFLTWLASWLAFVFDESWSEEKRREFLKAVPELYKMRGTRKGLEKFIEICTGQKPIIVENFQLRCIEDEEIRKIWTNLFNDSVYSFCVLLSSDQAKAVNTIRRIVESEKPAHTNAGVTVLQPWIYLGMHTYLGINSVLSEPVFRLGETSVISRDTVLSDPEEGGQLERRARVEKDTILT